MLGSRQGSRGSQLAPLKCASPSRSNAQSRGSTASAAPLDDGRSSIRSSSVSGAAEPLPSHIPPEFHIREDGALVFPSRRPQGDEDVPRLERVLQDMLSAWNGRLEQHRFSVTIDDTPWSLMQMLVYDIWCTIEETRIYDIAFVESLRMTHFYSASLALFLGKIRTRIAQSFGSILTMSRRLEVEMQRVQASWTDTGRLYHEEVGMRHAAEHHIRHLEAKLAMLETRTLAESKGSLLKNGKRTDQAIKQAQDEEKKGEALIRLQSEVLTLTKQVRALRAANTSLRTSEMELQLSNEGLRGEIEKLRAENSTHDATPLDEPPALIRERSGIPQLKRGSLLDVSAAKSPSSDRQRAATEHVLRAFKHMPRDEQQECLSALQKHFVESEH